MRDTWTVEEYATGTETAASEISHFDSFEAAYSRLLKSKQTAAIVRIMGPTGATDEQRRMIEEAGGQPTFES